MNFAALAAPLDLTTPPAVPEGVTLQSVKLGDGQSTRSPEVTVLADADNKTLYVFDGDSDGKSTCISECTERWRPLEAVDSRPFGSWSVVDRSDGSKQWAYRGKPLYAYHGDERYGDTKGDGVKGGWHVALYMPAEDAFMPPSIKALVLPNAMGVAFVTKNLIPLYIFEADSETGRPTCRSDSCTKLWRPFEAAQMSQAVGNFTPVRRDDGLFQWTYNGSPLYTHINDEAPGDARGNGVGGQWRAALLESYFMPAGVLVVNNRYGGSNLATEDGRTLYVHNRVVGTQQGRSQRFGLKISPAVGHLLGVSTCDVACAQTWRPLEASSEAVPSAFWSVVTRSDGSRQWAYRGFPLYTYVGDKNPGDMNGNEIYEIMDDKDPYREADFGANGLGAMVWHAVSP